MAHYIPTTFDYTRVEIWVPLIVGARIAILPYADAFDGRTLESTLRKSRAFSTLRMVLFGGDAANPKAVARLLEKDTHSEPVSIGRPTGDTVVHILDDALQPVPGGEVGEVFLGGPGVSRGYMNAQAKNTTSFINIKSPPGLDETTRVYRTGDLVRHDPSSGQIYYLGRQDHQVTIFTMRIELAAVKATLMKTGRFVDAVALAIHSLIKEMGKLLVSYIIPAEDVANDKAMPQIEVIDRFSLNVHFKVDRQALSRRYLATCDSYMQRNDNDPAQTTEQKLAYIWAGVLIMPAVKFTGEDNFFSFIRSEFQGAYLLQQIQRAFGANVFLHELQTNPTLYDGWFD